MNEMISFEQTVFDEIDSIQALCEHLMKAPHYRRMGAEGIFAIVQKAKTLGVHPLDALNGSLYYVNGKVEMSSQMMAQLIRQRGHSICKDVKSDDSVCILHGCRADNGDTWTEYFSLQDAQRAGIYKRGGPWEKYPRNMLYARALSNLARQLFPDVIKGCYVEGEIRDAGPLHTNTHPPQPLSEPSAQAIPPITAEQCATLRQAISGNAAYLAQVLDFLRSHRGVHSLEEMPADLYERALEKARKLSDQKNMDVLGGAEHEGEPSKEDEEDEIEEGFLYEEEDGD